MELKVKGGMRVQVRRNGRNEVTWCKKERGRQGQREGNIWDINTDQINLC